MLGSNLELFAHTQLPAAHRILRWSANLEGDAHIVLRWSANLEADAPCVLYWSADELLQEACS